MLLTSPKQIKLFLETSKKMTCDMKMPRVTANWFTTPIPPLKRHFHESELGTLSLKLKVYKNPKANKIRYSQKLI